MPEAPRRSARLACLFGRGSIIRVIACSFGCWVGLGSIPAAALPSQVQLRWSAPEGCPTAGQARHGLEDLLSGADATALPDSRVEIQITSHGTDYVASIEFAGESSGERALTGDNCQTLSNAALLITALTIDPLTAADNVSLGAPAPAAPSGRLAQHGEPSRGDARLRGVLGLHMSADLGTLPNATVGPTLEAGIELARLRLVAEGTWWVPQVKARGVDAGGRMGLAEAGVRGCWELMHGTSFGAGPCAAFTAGSHWGSGGQNLAPRRDASVPWAAARLGIRLRQQSDNMFLDAAIDAGYTVVGPHYTINEGEFFLPRWFGRLALGFGWRW